MSNIRKILTLNLFFLLLAFCTPSDPVNQLDIISGTQDPTDKVCSVQIVKTAYEYDADFTLDSAYLREEKLYITAASTVRENSAGTTIRLRIKDANGTFLTKGPSGWVIVSEAANGQCVLVTIGIPIPVADTIIIEGIEQINIGGIIKNAASTVNACIKKELQRGNVSLYVPAALLRNSQEIGIAAPAAALPPLPAYAISAGEPFELLPDALQLAALPAITSTAVKHFIDYVDYIQQGNEPATVTIRNMAKLDDTHCPGLLCYQPGMSGSGQWVTIPVQKREFNAEANSYNITANLLHFSVYAPVQYEPVQPEALLTGTLTFNSIKTQLDYAEENARQKADELEQIYQLLSTPTNENFQSYLQNGQLSNSHNSLTASEALINDINLVVGPDKWIPARVETCFYFNFPAPGGTGFLPLLHSTVKLSPADGKGPSYLIDRYVPALKNFWLIGDERILSQSGLMEYDLRNIFSVPDFFADWQKAITAYATTASTAE